MWPPAGHTIKVDFKYCISVEGENALFWGTPKFLTPCHERILSKEHNNNDENDCMNVEFHTCYTQKQWPLFMIT